MPWFLRGKNISFMCSFTPSHWTQHEVATRLFRPPILAVHLLSIQRFKNSDLTLKIPKTPLSPPTYILFVPRKLHPHPPQHNSTLSCHWFFFFHFSSFLSFFRLPIWRFCPNGSCSFQSFLLFRVFSQTQCWGCSEKPNLLCFSELCECETWKQKP